MKKFNSFWWKAVAIGLVALSSMVWGAGNKPVSVVKLSVNSTQTDLSLCAVLNKYVYASDSVVAKPYVQLTPNQPFTLELSYNGICLKGLKPRTKYQVSINRNIPLGEFKLDRDYTLSGTTRDFDPSMEFQDGGYILPAKGEISIPIETINVHELAISLYRINTKNLIGKINEYGLIRELYNSSIEKVASTEGYFLWQKRLKIRSDLNRAKTTAVPVGDFLKERKPGVYILQAQEVGSDGELVDAYYSKTQWFMVSDIGIYTLRGDDGLFVYTKKLSNAENYNQVKLELISRNNEVLDSVVSKNGQAFFPDKVLNGKRGLKPKAIYAYGENDDFSIIDLSRPSHDLSDRGVQGRDNPGKYDAYVYSNRGIFRPGETVPIEILLRNHLGEAKGGEHLSLKLFDSRQVEVLTKLLTTDALGHTQESLDISESASRGKWYMKLYAGGSETVGGISFLVEDFIPPKIKVDATIDASVLKPNVKSQLKVSAHYLSGEVLTDASVEVMTILHHAKKPFELYESYQFGDMRERVGNLYLTTFDGKTDENGNVTIPFVVDNIPETTLPLSAHITVSVSEPGGRPVEKVIDRFLEDKAGYIGIKANFENASVDMGSHPIFDLVYLQSSHLKSRALSYRVVEEEVHWNWRSVGGDWTYHKTYSDAEEVAKGGLESSASEPVSLTLPKLDWGSYRVEITDQENAKILSTYRFGSGYEESMSKASPDRLPVAIDKHDYSVGDEVRVHITAKFSGPIIVAVANHTILESKTIQAKVGEEQEVTFRVRKNWGSSTYILATAFRAQSKKLGANRAIGLAHIAIVDPKKVIKMTLEHPVKVSSFESVKIKIIAKEMAGESAFVTLGAVDEGVLRLTNYQAPDPVAYFYGQQKLGMKIRDIYGDLIEAKGAHAQFNVGAGDMLSEELQEKPVANKRKVVALFSGAVAFDREGKAEIVLDIPDYQGSLRLMAVAWSDKAVGAKSSDLVVKDMISAEIYMPKFISVGDQAMGHLSIGFDKNATAGKYTIRLTNRSNDGVIDSKEFAFVFEGKESGRFTAPVLLRAPSLQDLNLAVEVLHEGDVLVEKEWELAVRSRYPEVTIGKVGLLAKGSLFDPQALFDSSIWSKPHQVSLKFSGKPLFAAASLADELINYWGRCAEQTTSRAMPWLFMSATSELAKKINIQAIIPQAIEQLLLYQNLTVVSGYGAEVKQRCGYPRMLWTF